VKSDDLREGSGCVALMSKGASLLSSSHWRNLGGTNLRVKSQQAYRKVCQQAGPVSSQGQQFTHEIFNHFCENGNWDK
jgi:hypothetical protein